MALGGSATNKFGLTDTYTVGTQSITYGTGQGLVSHSVSYSDGAGASAVEAIGTLVLTLTGGSDSIDLNADLENPSGTAPALDGVKVFCLFAPSTNSGSVTITTNSTNQWDAAIDGVIVLKPGTSIQLISSNATAYAVTAGTADLLGVSGTASDVLQVAVGGTV